jgi:serine/threonine protein kinase
MDDSAIDSGGRPVRRSHEPPVERPAPRRLAAGATLDLGWGRVVVGEGIGEGGMGVVHRGWLYFHPRGPRAGTSPCEVAIKVLHPTLSARPNVRKLFLGEARALARLSHPNVVAFHGMCDVASTPRAGTVRLAEGSREDAQLAIVIELVDGEPLSTVIERHVARARPGGLPALPFARAWHYFEQLLGALAATHAIGIVHRDVKPANVLIRRDGVVKLGDFGIARMPEATESTGALQPGTGAYMSPEQVLGRPLDGRSDLYSAAVVLYESLTGAMIFELGERNEFVVRAAQVERPPVPLSRRMPQAPPVLDALLARALAKDPADRFATAIEMGDAFLAALRLPESEGWRAQKRLASSAASIATPVRRGHAATQRIAPGDADAMRAAVAGAYRG